MRDSKDIKNKGNDAYEASVNQHPNSPTDQQLMGPLFSTK